MSEQQTPLYIRIAEVIRKANGDTPLSYLEFREADYKLAKERKEVVNIIGSRIRELCRAEIDDYVNCYGECIVSLLQCRKEAATMKQCVRRYQEEMITPESLHKLMEERLRTGESFIVPSYIKKKVEQPYTNTVSQPQKPSK